MKTNRSGGNNPEWIPSLLYAAGFLILDYGSGIRSIYIDRPGDHIWAAPAGLTTILILPLGARLYVQWLNLKFGIPCETKLKINPWLISEILPWLAAILLCIIDRPLTAYTLAATVVWSVTGLLRRISDMARRNGTSLTRTQEYIAVLFFISGFSALIYQIVWQRVLFTAFGVDSESITVIVSVFMFGLGIGALVGSWLVKFRPWLLRIFLSAEIGIGVFGFFSIPLTRMLIHHVSYESDTGLALICYIIFAVPTLLMGITLPVLVGHLNLYYKNLGRSTGLLYAANTLGSALAALMTVSVIFALTGQRGATLIAAFFNLTTAVLLYLSIGGLEQQSTPAPKPVTPSGVRISFTRAAILSTGIGFAALSSELLYFRLLNFTTAGLPHVFGWLLAAYLSGIAAGSLHVKKLSEQAGKEIKLTGFLFSAGIIVLFTPAVLGFFSGVSARPFALLVGLLLFGVFGFLTGGVLPYLCNARFGKNEGDNDKGMALIYMFNILGAALGPLLTGYVVLEYLPAVNVSIMLAVLLMTIGYSLHMKKRDIRVMVPVLALLVIADPVISRNFLDRLQSETLVPVPFRYIVENRVSIITVAPDKRGDIVYGGGIYDGRVNIDPLVNYNGIQRAYYSACLHPDPRRVLEIGLSSGSWARVLLSYDRVHELVSVEINPGYHNIISRYPKVADILGNPRFNLVYDDGRRWLRRHPDEKFDLISINASFHWRANITNLLSQEFFRLIRDHLNRDGVVYFNATGSIDAAYTVASVFRHVLSYGSFYAASDTPFKLTDEQKRNNFLQFTDDSGAPYFLQSNGTVKLMDHLVAEKQEDLGTSLRNDQEFRVITDDNMLVEYKLSIFHALQRK